SPSQVSFGTVATGMTKMQNVVISNAGNAPLAVSGIQLISPTPAVTLANLPALPLMIQPGTAITVSLRFSPTAPRPVMASLVVTSNDRVNGTLTIPVQGIGAVPNTCTINVVPSARTFGIVEPGRVVTLPVEIQSVGSQPCNLSNFSIGGAQE